MWRSPDTMRSLARLFLEKASQCPHAGQSRGLETASTQASSALKVWEASSSTTPPVSFVQGMAPPTAMSWLRRRGPTVSHTVLQQLFRSRQVRVFDGEKVRRVKDDKVLGLGDIVLYPKIILFGGKTDREAGLKLADSGHSSGASPPAARKSSSTTTTTTSSSSSSSRAQQLNPHQSPQQNISPESPTAPVSDPAGKLRHVSSSAPSQPQSSPAHQPLASALSSFPESVQQHISSASQHHTTSQTNAQASASTAPLEGRAAQVKAASSQPSQKQVHGSDLPSSREGPAPSSTSKHDQALSAAGTAAGLERSRVRKWMLGNTSDMVFINKPAGVASMGPDSLNSMMQQGLRLGPIDEPKLVHRLDKLVSGAMVVARNADAAHWLSACFREKSAQGVTPGAEPQLPPSMHVKRVYWAFVAGYLQPRLTGRIRYPILVDGKFHPAVTQFRVKHTSEGVSWLELVPETGRRHQLRIHCAQCLRTPIIGDTRYGYKGLTPTQGLFRGVPREWWDTFGGSRQLPSGDQAGGDSETGHRSGRGSRGAGSHREQHVGVDQESYDDGDDDAGLEEGEEMAQMDGHEGGEGWGGGGEGGGEKRGGDPAGGPLPIFLHSRRLVVKKPLRHAVVAIAPLPRYIRQLVAGLGWPLPTH